MDFPYWGDAGGYEALGNTCAEFLQSFGATGTCYEAVRPLGIAFYFALPHFFSTNPVTVNSITLLMNLICLIVVIGSLVMMFLDATRSASNPRVRKSQWVFAGLIVFGTTVVMLPFVPLRMAEAPAFATLFSGMYLLGRATQKKSGWLAFVGAGVLVGTSVIMRPVNVVAGVVALALVSGIYLYRAVKQSESRVQNILRPVFYFLGFIGPVSVQVWWVARHTGIPWLFDKRVISPIPQPWVELRAAPFQSSILTQLTEHLSGIEYFFVKFYEGLSKLDLAIYGVDAGSPYVAFGVKKLVVAVLLLAVISAILLWPVVSAPPSLWFASVSVWVSMIYVTWTYHVETRYFAPVRLMVLVVICVMAERLVRMLQSRRSPKRIEVPATNENLEVRARKSEYLEDASSTD